ncbi:MAG: ABC transporter permease [Chloroflexota bacterium]
MATYLVRRLLIAIPTLFGITILAFVALAIAPGDPLTASIEPDQLARMTAEQKAEARHELGLDQPIPVRYAVWLGDILRGDLGYSIVNRRNVADDLTQRLGPTLLLMGTAALLGIPVGIGLGMLAATRQYGLPDYLSTGFSTLFIAIPGFVVGLVLIYFLGANLKLLPTSGMVTLGKGGDPVDLARHMVMPVLLLGLAIGAQVARYTRTALLEVMGSEYVTTARSKGLRSRRILWRHGFRNALIPIITVIGLILPDLVAGAVITESLFGWPGMGQLAVKAAEGRDPALMMGVILVIAVGVLIANIITDVAYAIADPRVRLGERA